MRGATGKGSRRRRRVLDPLGRRRMVGEEARPRRIVAGQRLLALERVQHRRQAGWIPAGARGERDADSVRLALLLAAVGR